MKLTEIAKSDITMMSDGFYLEADPKQEPGIKTYAIKRLMQDEEIGEASIISTEGDEWDGIWRMTVNGQKKSARVGSSKMLYRMKDFGEWVRKHLRDQLGEDLNSDLRKARIAKKLAKSAVWLHRLNKDGTESGMHDAKHHYDSEDQALAGHKYMVSINPGKLIQHHLYSTSGMGTFKLKLVNGKQVKS